MKNAEFQESEVWQKAKTLAVKLYEVSKTFPREDLDGLTSQIRRSAIFIPSVISNGLSKTNDKEIVRFIAIALGSSSELKTQLIIAKEVGILKSAEFGVLDNELQSVVKMLKDWERNIKTRYLQ